MSSGTWDRVPGWKIDMTLVTTIDCRGDHMLEVRWW